MKIGIADLNELGKRLNEFDPRDSILSRSGQVKTITDRRIHELLGSRIQRAP